MHFHDLRHTGTSSDAGANLRELMERMGHSTTRAATVYLHGGDERQQDIADELSRQTAEQLGRSKAKPSGTAAPVGIMMTCSNISKRLADLGLELCAPTATRTRGPTA